MGMASLSLASPTAQAALDLLRDIAAKQARAQAAAAPKVATDAARNLDILAKKVLGEENFKTSAGTVESYKDILYGKDDYDSIQQRSADDMDIRQSDAIFSALVNAFATDAQMRQTYDDKVSGMRRQEPRMHKGAASFASMQDVIFDNREKFPPQEFVLRIDLWDPGQDQSSARSLVIKIPSLAMVNAMKFAERNAEKERAYFQALADTERHGKVDPATTQLMAMSKALQTLLVDNEDVAKVGDEQASQATLAKPFIDAAAKKDDR